METTINKLSELINKLLGNNSKQQEIITEQIELLTELVEKYETTKE